MSGQKEQTELQVFKTVLMHCLVIIACPVITFFVARSFIFDTVFKSSPVTSSVYSAGAAVLVLHFALGLYIYRAYFDSPTKISTKTD